MHRSRPPAGGRERLPRGLARRELRRLALLVPDVVLGADRAAVTIGAVATVALALVAIYSALRSWDALQLRPGTKADRGAGMREFRSAAA